MKMPNADTATIARAKVLDYLLAEAHPHGRHKAAFFTRFGFSRDAWQVLASVLARHGAENEVSRTEDSRFGTRYIIQGAVTAPDGRRPMIRTVWFVETGESTPRFVTAYPLEREKT
jgi:hypothetical protein